ncbi:hypothetical protein PsexTeo8_23390 [Pseudomonas extremaustralis]|nr:hypothetical protein [Pseudomonas extremaustralis]
MAGTRVRLVGIAAHAEVSPQAPGKMRAHFQPDVAADAVQQRLRAGGLGQPAMGAIHLAQARRRAGHADLVVFQAGGAGLGVNAPDKRFIPQQIEATAHRGAGQCLLQAPGKVGLFAAQQQWVVQFGDNLRGDGCRLHHHDGAVVGVRHAGSPKCVLFPVGRDTFLRGKSSQSGKRAMPLEISLAAPPFGAWKLLVFRQRSATDGELSKSANTTEGVAALVGACAPRTGA